MLKLFYKNNTKHVRLRVKYIFSVSVCSSILGKWSWVSPALLSSIDPGGKCQACTIQVWIPFGKHTEGT